MKLVFALSSAVEAGQTAQPVSLRPSEHLEEMAAAIARAQRAETLRFVICIIAALGVLLTFLFALHLSP